MTVYGATAAPPGPPGDKGDTGDTGADGLQGIQGVAGDQGIQGIQGNVGNTGATGPSGGEVLPWYMQGPVVQLVGKSKVYVEAGYTIDSVRVALNTVGSTSTIVDVNIDGVTIYTTQANRPTLGTSVATVLSTNFDINTIAGGHYLTVDVDAAGTSAADLTITIRMHKT